MERAVDHGLAALSVSCCSGVALFHFSVGVMNLLPTTFPTLSLEITIYDCSSQASMVTARE